MMEPPRSAETRSGDRSAPKRNCYCGSFDREFLRQQGIPEGFCGICERCGKPGHTQHFPGPVPYTGAWCDRCVKIVALTWYLKNPMVWLAVGIGIVVAMAFVRR